MFLLHYHFGMSKPPVKISDLVDAIQLGHDEMTSYLDRETGAVVTVTRDDTRAAENENVKERAPEWQEESIALAAKILEDADGRFLELPDKFDAHEWRMMEVFTFTVNAEAARSVLESAIHGKGAFRRFEDSVNRYDLDKEWYAFRDAQYAELAIKWCKQEGIEFVP